MKIAFLTDPLSQFKIYKDSTYAMMSEAVSRGHKIFAFGPSDLALKSGRVSATVREVHLTNDGATWYQLGEVEDLELQVFDAVLQRKDPPFDMEYIYSTYLLDLAEHQGALVFNKPSAIRDHNEKLSIAQFPQFTTPTLVTRSEQKIRAFFDTHRDVILKPLDGMGGTGIFRIREDGMNLGSVIETLTENQQRTIMVQKYIPEIVDGDKRILLIGGKVVPFALARIPQGGEVRGNLAAGGIGVAQKLNERDLEIAQTLAPILSERGLLLVGLDVIGNYLTEVNVTSPTCFQEITQQTGINVAAMFVDALEHQVGSKDT
ncbi:glutathione synthase [Undibacterium fentianense]|uniref:Glutathione synthetase n=1 Tax=Undibacterium fentianense TaxID=2828728 RepID=A0A941E617_9BURK|nr:glutathione synthase [Undibacterium fentianense]MBR7801802.1 glutathione synthase [Undibacterium fentianense]